MNFKKMSLKALSVLLAAMMLLGVCAPAIGAATWEHADHVHDNGRGELVYVSLGDSMTNGYGLDGYTAEAGVYDYGYYSYANQFAAALAGYTTEEFKALAEGATQGFGLEFSRDGMTVEHRQLAMSAMRPEDIYFLLTLDYENPEAVKLLDKYPTDDKVFYRCSSHSGLAYEDIVYCSQCKWDWVDEPGYDAWDGSYSVDDYPAWWTVVHGEAWENLFHAGDFWTWKELAEDYRFGTAATYIKSIFGTEAEKARAAELMANRPSKPRDDGSNGEETCYVAKHYQEAVAEADVVSIALGNGNFGVWLMGRITDAIMKFDGTGRNSAYDVEKVLARCEPVVREQISAVLVEIDPAIEQYIGTMMGALDAETAASVKSVATYAVVSFMVNYAATIERILELNPDVEIITLGLMNTYAGDDVFAEEGQVTIGQILDVIFPVLNVYVAGLPTFLKLADPAYKNVSFYYAEEYTIECLIQNFGDASFMNWEGVARQRFVEGVVGECDCGKDCADLSVCEELDGLFWSMLNGYEMGGAKIQGISMQDVKDYDAMDDIARAKFAVENKDKAVSIAVYLAIEDAICKSGRLAPVTLTTLTSLDMGDPALLKTALDNFEAELNAIIGNYNATAIAALAELGVTEPTETQINDFSMVLALPTALSNALWTDSTLCSMLAVVARNKLGNGLGAHPSVNGHASLADAMILSYTEGYTTGTETLANLVAIAKGAYEKAMADGRITEALAYINEVIDANLPAFMQSIFTDDYTITADSYYVAITGANSAYADLLAETLGVASGKQTWGALDFDDLAKADLITVGYDLAEINCFTVNQLLAYAAELLDGEVRTSATAYAETVVNLMLADTVLSDDAVAEYVAEVQASLNGSVDEILASDLLIGKTREPMDWAAVMGEEKLASVERALNAAEAELNAAGVPATYSFEFDVIGFIFNNTDLFSAELADKIAGFDQDEVYTKLGDKAYYTVEIPAAEVALLAVESFLYCNVTFQAELAATMATLAEINPDAAIAVLGQYNAFDGLTVELGETTVCLGDAYDVVAKLASAHILTYAISMPNVIYVDIADAADDLSIAEQILNAYTVTCAHSWTDATCTEAKTCALCGETDGEALGHVWTDATCTVAKTCSVCGETEGEASGHVWTDATCTEAKTCSVCGETEGDALGHKWTDATCTVAKTCTVCGETEGETLGHTWTDATCTTPKTCTVCGETEGDVTDHAWADATCTAGKTCGLCGETEGTALGHDWISPDIEWCKVQSSCMRCGATQGEDIEEHTYTNACDTDCDVCGATRTPDDHAYGEWNIVTEATKKAEGKQERTCTVCGNVESEAIPQLEGCASVLGTLTVICMTLASAAVVIRKRDEE